MLGRQTEFCHVGITLRKHGGEIIREFQTEKPVFSSRVVHQGIVYNGSGDARLYALGAVTGKEIWSYLTTNWVISSPAAYEGVVAVTSHYYLHILNAVTGKHRLNYVPGMGNGSSVVDGKTGLWQMKMG